MQRKGYTAKEILKVLKDALDSYFRPEKSADNCRQVINLEWTLALVFDNFCEKRGSSDSDDDDSHRRIETIYRPLVG